MERLFYILLDDRRRDKDNLLSLLLLDPLTDNSFEYKTSFDLLHF